MTDSVGQKIARKLNDNCCLQHLRPESESMLGIAAIIDAEFARELATDKQWREWGVVEVAVVS